MLLLPASQKFTDPHLVGFDEAFDSRCIFLSDHEYYGQPNYRQDDTSYHSDHLILPVDRRHDGRHYRYSYAEDEDSYKEECRYKTVVNKCIHVSI